MHLEPQLNFHFLDTQLRPILDKDFLVLQIVRKIMWTENGPEKRKNKNRPKTELYEG